MVLSFKDGLDLSEWIGETSRTNYDSSFWATYEIDSNLWTGVDASVQVEMETLEDGSFLVFHRSASLTRQFLAPSGSGMGGPGGPGNSGSNPFEQV